MEDSKKLNLVRCIRSNIIGNAKIRYPCKWVSGCRTSSKEEDVSLTPPLSRYSPHSLPLGQPKSMT